MEDLEQPINLKMVIEYDGTRYCGWERQKNGLAIQEVLEEAVLSITGAQVVIEGSGRTDAGVHAEGQVASFHFAKRMAPEKLRLALNAVIPKDISIKQIEEAALDFHARKSARSKRYRYTTLMGRTRRPLLSAFTYHHPWPLDIPHMREASLEFVGTHDFVAFAREAERKKTCVRTILETTLETRDDLLIFEIEGTGFLYNMVRIIMGTLLDVGSGKKSLLDVKTLLEGTSRVEAGPTVPAQGLTLLAVRY